MNAYSEILKPRIIPISSSKNDVPPPPGYSESVFSTATKSLTSSGKKTKHDDADLNALKSRKFGISNWSSKVDTNELIYELYDW